MCAYRGYMQGMQQMVPTAISQVVEQVGKLAVGLTLAFMLLDAGPEYAAMGALIGVTVSELLASFTLCFPTGADGRRSGPGWNAACAGRWSRWRPG